MSGYKQTRDAAGKVTTQYDKMLRNLDDDLMDRLRGVTGGKLDYTNTPNSLRLASADHIEELEAKLAKAVETISLCRKMQAQFAHTEDPLMVLLDTTIAELRSPMKGQKDEWKCPINHPNCEQNCGNYGCGN